MSKKSEQKAGRVVRYTKADGTVVTKHYAAYVKPGAAATPAPAAPVYTPPPTPPAPTASAVTVSDLITAWQRSPAWNKLAPSSKVTYNQALRRVGMANTPVSEVTRGKLLARVEAIIEAIGPGAAAVFITTCQAMFKYALRREWIVASPVTMLRDDVEMGEFAPWSMEEYELAQKYLPERLRRATVLALYTAQRRSDLIKMKWSDYDGATIYVKQQKTGAELWLPVDPMLKAELEGWRPSVVVDLAGKPTGTILLTGAGLPWTGNNLSAQILRELARIPGFPTGHNIHGLRKLSLTLRANSGSTAKEIMAWSGHKSMAQAEKYIESSDQKGLAASSLAKLAARRIVSGTTQ